MYRINVFIEFRARNLITIYKNFYLNLEHENYYINLKKIEKGIFGISFSYGSIDFSF